MIEFESTRIITDVRFLENCNVIDEKEKFDITDLHTNEMYKQHRSRRLIVMDIIKFKFII